MLKLIVQVKLYNENVLTYTCTCKKKWYMSIFGVCIFLYLIHTLLTVVAQCVYYLAIRTQMGNWHQINVISKVKIKVVDNLKWKYEYILIVWFLLQYLKNDQTLFYFVKWDNSDYFQNQLWALLIVRIFSL